MESAGTIDLGAFLLQHAFDLAHRHIPVAPRIAFEPLSFGPVGGVNAGPSVECIDGQTAIIR